MSRNYSEKEKQEYLDKYKVIGKSKTIYARENGIPEATFRAWVKEEQYGMFGAIEINEHEQVTQVFNIFSNCFMICCLITRF